MELFATTGDAFVKVGSHAGLEGSGAQCLALDGDAVYVGCRGGGLKRSADRGDTFEDVPLPEPDVFSVAVSAADGAVYVGTEPSRLFRSRDGGERFEELVALQDIPSRPEWRFPPRPWTSHVRWIAPSPHDPDLILVGIELGGLMRSTDGGATWQDHRPGAQRDVHSLAWHPRTRGRAYEAGGGGAAFSTDAGETWQPADEGRDRHYTWSVTVDPDDPDRWYVSASTGPYSAHGRGDPQARIYRRRDCDSWQPLTAGRREPLPAMPSALLATDGRVFAGLASGHLWESPDRGDSWTAMRLEGDTLVAVLALALVPGVRGS